MTEQIYSDSGNQREYSRVDAFIPMELKLLDKAQKQYLRSRIAGEAVLADFLSLPDPEDKVIADWLKMINTKLNYIIRMMTIDHEGFNQMPIRKVNISGGGMSFLGEMKYSQGDILEFKLILTMHYPLALFLYGEVIEEIKHNPDFDTFVHFIAIDDFIRDEIIRFVFEKEREILREKRR